MYMEFSRFIDFAFESQMENMGCACHNDRHLHRIEPIDDVVMWYEIALGREKWQNVYVKIPKTFTDADLAETGIVTRHRPFALEHTITLKQIGPREWPDLLEALRMTQGIYNLEIDGVSYGGQSYHVPYATSFDGKCNVSFDSVDDLIVFKLVWKDVSLLAGSDGA